MAQLPTVEQLLEAGVHFGHRTNKWNPKMSEFIYTERGGIHIIDLSKTIAHLEEALNFLSDTARGGEVLVVGTKRQARNIVQQYGDKVGVHYITNRWPGGLVTNFKIHSKSIKKMLDLEEDLAGGVENRTKQEIVWMKRERDRLERLFGGVKFMRNVPAAIIIVDPKTERIAVKEAKKMGIPTIGIVDTNCDPDSVDYAIPANDDALKSLELIIKLITDTVSGAKGPSDAISSLRKSHEAKLEKLAQDSKIKQELRKRDEEQRMQEIKALKEGKKVAVVEDKGGVQVVRAQAETPVTTKTPAKGAGEKTTAKKAAAKVEVSEELSKLAIAPRTLKTLASEGVKTLDDLKKLSDEELLRMPGVGEKALAEIKKAL